MFRKIATKISTLTGHAAAFALAFMIVVVWAITGPLFDFSNTWQLVINTFTTITTFLMVFLIQNTQNRDGKAVQLKLDELLLATRGRDAFVDLEEMSDEELDELEREFRALKHKLSGSPTMKRMHEKLETERTHRKKHSLLDTINPLK